MDSAYTVELPGLPYEKITAAVRLHDAVIQTVAVEFLASALGVQFREIHDDGLVAVLAVPQKTRRTAGTVLVLGGSDGSLDSAKLIAGYLASHGFPALALAWFAQPGLPSSIDRIPVEYFGKAIHWLKAEPSLGARSRGIGVLGVSRGGEAALLLGSRFPELKAVVGLAPGGVLLQGDEGHSSWSEQGLDIPYFSLNDYVPVTRTIGDGRLVTYYGDSFRNLLQLHNDLIEPAVIPVEHGNATYLLLAGDDDQLWPSCFLADIAMQRLLAAHRSQRDQLVCYPNAGHLVGVIPGGPTTVSIFQHPILQDWEEFGGNPSGNARAQKGAWGQVLRFLAREL